MSLKSLPIKLPRACKIPLPLLLISLLISYSLPIPVHAASSQGLNIQISPLPIQLVGKPGSTLTNELRVRNSGTADETLKVTVVKISTEGADGHIVFHDLTPSDPLGQWIHFSKTVFNAPAGEWQSITMTVNLPTTAAYGYYYAVQFQLANPPTPQPGKAGILGATDIFVLLNAEAPGETPKAEVKSFSVDHKSYEFLPVGFNVQIHNSGNIHVAPHGNIFINRGSSQVGSVDVNSTEGNILPGSNRIFKARWADGFPVYSYVLDANGQTVDNGHGQAKQRLSWNFSQVPKLRFGHYNARLVLVYNNGQSDIPITANVSFWVIPWRLMLASIFVGIFVLIGLWSTVKKIRRVALKQKQQRLHK